MPRFARLSALALVAACGASTAAATRDSTKGVSTTPPPATANGHDWSRFNVDEPFWVFDAPTGITAAVLPTMRRGRSRSAAVDARQSTSARVSVGGAAHDLSSFTRATEDSPSADNGRGL